jgi:tetratricopeptide (TPR) repeat protein
LNDSRRAVSNARVSHRFFALCVLLAVCVVPSFAAETLAEKTLKEIVERQKQLFARAEKEGEQLDEARFAAEAKALAGSYDVFIQKNPDFAPGYVAYGVFLGKIDMTKAAVAMLLKANKLDPNIPLVKNQLAKHLAEDGKPLEALPYLTSAIDLAPTEPLYHFHLGQLLLEAREDFLREGGWTRAALDKSMLEAFQRAADLAPADLSLAYQHAKAYYEIEPPRWEEALAVWEKLGGRATSETMRQLVKLQRANILVKLSRGDEARAVLDQVTDLKLTDEKQKVLDAIATAKK